MFHNFIHGKSSLPSALNLRLRRFGLAPTYPKTITQGVTQTIPASLVFKSTTITDHHPQWPGFPHQIPTVRGGIGDNQRCGATDVDVLLGVDDPQQWAPGMPREPAGHGS